MPKGKEDGPWGQVQENARGLSVKGPGGRGSLEEEVPCSLEAEGWGMCRHRRKCGEPRKGKVRSPEN